MGEHGYFFNHDQLALHDGQRNRTTSAGAFAKSRHINVFAYVQIEALDSCHDFVDIDAHLFSVGQRSGPILVKVRSHALNGLLNFFGFACDA